MASINLIEAFQEFKDAENIDRPTLMRVVEDVFKTLLRKKYGSDDNFDVIVNAEKGDLEIFRRRMIVEDGDIYNTLEEIEYKDAVKISQDYEVGEELYEEVNLVDFGRRAILAAKQTLASTFFFRSDIRLASVCLAARIARRPKSTRFTSSYNSSPTS